MQFRFFISNTVFRKKKTKGMIDMSGNYYWSPRDESWGFRESGKFELVVNYGGRTFSAKYKDENKCRDDIQNSISKCIKMGIIEGADNAD